MISASLVGGQGLARLIVLGTWKIWTDAPRDAVRMKYVMLSLYRHIFHYIAHYRNQNLLLVILSRFNLPNFTSYNPINISM